MPFIDTFTMSVLRGALRNMRIIQVRKKTMEKIFFFVVCYCLLLLTPFTVLALERFDLVTTREMKQLLEEREKGLTDFILVNTLDEMIYRDSYIPGSINIPLSRFDAFNHRLGTNKDKLIITYCMGYR